MKIGSNQKKVTKQRTGNNGIKESKEIEFSDDEEEEPKLIEPRESWAKAKREDLMMKGISFDESRFPFNEVAVTEKAKDLGKIMPKLEYRDMLLMSGFIHENKEKLINLAKELHPNGLYLRREVSGLPLSLLITPEGQCIWATKTKAIYGKVMGDSFKKVHKCIDHDNLNFYIMGTMSIDKSNKIKSNTAIRELNAGEAMKNLPNVAQVIHSMNYEAKSGRALPEKIQILMEYYPKGDLKEMIGTNALLEDKKEKITESLLNGVLAIHDEGWIHGDFKPGNIFFDDNLEPHIGDFGFTHPKSEVAESGLTVYFHPDFYLSSGENRLVQQEKADMFALGLTLAQMELDLDALPWDNKDFNFLTHQAATFNSPALKGRVKDQLADGLNKLYQNFPEKTVTQKLIKKLINPNLSEIPTAAEAKIIWNNLLENKESVV